jgi:ribosome-binding protein aMBF1 (putative translation factor)
VWNVASYIKEDNMVSTHMKVVKTIEVEVPDLPERIKIARVNDTRSIAEICRQLEMSTTHWYRIEHGIHSMPLETLRRIEHVLNIDLGVNID